MNVRSITAVVACALIGNTTITLGIVLEAALFRRASPIVSLLRLLQWDASNAIGASAFSKGWNAALLGFAMDIVVAGAWATVFVVALNIIPVIRRQLVLSALCFGAVVMCVMFYVIVPLGHARPPSNSVDRIVLSLIAHTLFFGIPVAFVAAAMLGRREPLATESICASATVLNRLPRCKSHDLL